MIIFVVDIILNFNMKHRLFTLAAASLLFAACGNPQQEAATSDSNTMKDRDFIQLATDRYSVRSFASIPVEQDKIDLILRAGQIAPTAVNSQPQKIYVAQTPEVIAKLNEVSPCLYGAPQCFVFCYNDENVIKRGEGNYGDIDVTIVLTHMMLEAENLGLGTCIVGRYDTAKLVESLQLPAGIHPVLLMPFGYPADDAKPSDKHTSYRPLEETVEYL